MKKDIKEVPKCEMKTPPGRVKTKTVLEWYTFLPPAIEKLAIVNSSYAQVQCLSLSNAINRSFTWVCAPEGYSFWSRVHETALKKEGLDKAIDELRKEYDELKYPETEENTVTINGKEYSEGTVALALKEYVN